MTEVFTIGHSGRSIAEFIDLLREYGVDQVADIRTVPKSRHNPQFGQELLAHSLIDAGIEYQHLAGLAGRRKARPDSINTGWRNESFRGYADYMQTGEFARAVEELANLASLQAGIHRLTVDNHGAGAAVAHVADLLGASELKVVPERVEQRASWLYQDGVLPAVDRERDRSQTRRGRCRGTHC